MMFRMQSAWSSFPRIRWWGVQWMVGRIPEVPTRVLEGLQEGGVAEQALEAALEDLGVLERARAQEVLQELGRGVVAEEAEVKALRVVEQLAHLLLIARAHARGHCATMRVFQCSFSRLLSRLQQISCPQLPCKYCGTRCPHPFRNRAFHTRWCASRLQERCAARARAPMEPTLLPAITRGSRSCSRSAFTTPCMTKCTQCVSLRRCTKPASLVAAQARHDRKEDPGKTQAGCISKRTCIVTLW